MDRIYYSIFNDALGPVMTGPSSSHSAGCNRIGQTARSLFGSEIKKADIIFEEKGSYPGTYIGQGSNFGFISGLLGYDTDDIRLKDAVEIAAAEGRDFTFSKADLGFLHPNQAKIIIYGENGLPVMTLMTFSVGGGMFKITGLDGFSIMTDGSRDQFFIYADTDYAESVMSCLEGYEISHEEGISGTTLITVDMAAGQDNGRILDLKHHPGVGDIRFAKALLPVTRDPSAVPPFFNAAEALGYGIDKKTWQLAVDYETAYGHVTEAGIREKTRHIREIMEASCMPPSPATTPVYGFLPYSAGKMAAKAESAGLIDAGLLNGAMTAAVSVMENSCAHNIIVAAPTAGSSGVVPATVVYMGRKLGRTDEEIENALLTAGLIGVFIANQATFAGETGACQAEMGSAAAMAAGGLAYLLGLGTEEIFRSASLALQNMLGLICDPVGGLTEIPCISRNVSAAANAVMSANMVLLGFDPVIPLDETIETAERVGRSIPAELRCTCEGGLCKTPTACRILKEINAGRQSLK